MYTYFRLSEQAVEIRVIKDCPLSFFLQLSEKLRVGLHHAVEVVNTEDSCVVFFKDQQSVDLMKTKALCEEFIYQEQQPRATKIIEIPCYYTTEGTDLRDLSDKLGLETDEVIRIHSSKPYMLAMYGFMPGFGYFTGLDKRLNIPRKSTPSVRVLPGSVAIAAGYTGIYPTESPGGWYVIGYTKTKLIDLKTSNLLKVSPGDWVQFVTTDEATYAEG